MTLDVQSIGDWMVLTHTSLDVGGLRAETAWQFRQRWLKSYSLQLAWRRRPRTIALAPLGHFPRHSPAFGCRRNHRERHLDQAVRECHE